MQDVKNKLASLLIAGMSLALSATVESASATPVPFFDSMPGSTTFIVPETGIYNILAFGAQGGNDGTGYGLGGLGAEIGGDFSLNAGEQLTVSVGGAGGNGTTTGFYPIGTFGGGGGGGGSFVVGPNSTFLVVAGGGGGGGQSGVGGAGQIGTSGGNSYAGGPANNVGGGGFNGSGGQSGGGGGGGGITYFGGSGRAEGGANYPSLLGGGGADGIGGNGGFGGGGGGDAESGRTGAGGGGGGGYSGGAGGFRGLGIGSGGGGGGSFDAGLTSVDLVLLAGVNSGNGSVTISELPSTAVPEPGSLALLGAGLVGLLALRRRRR